MNYGGSRTHSNLNEIIRNCYLLGYTFFIVCWLISLLVFLHMTDYLFVVLQCGASQACACDGWSPGGRPLHWTQGRGNSKHMTFIPVCFRVSNIWRSLLKISYWSKMLWTNQVHRSVHCTVVMQFVKMCAVNEYVWVCILLIIYVFIHCL